MSNLAHIELVSTNTTQKDGKQCCNDMVLLCTDFFTFRILLFFTNLLLTFPFDRVEFFVYLRISCCIDHA